MQRSSTTTARSLTEIDYAEIEARVLAMNPDGALDYWRSVMVEVARESLNRMAERLIEDAIHNLLTKPQVLDECHAIKSTYSKDRPWT